MPRLACKPFGDIHSICPQANTRPILVFNINLKKMNRYYHTYKLISVKPTVNNKINFFPNCGKMSLIALHHNIKPHNNLSDTYIYIHDCIDKDKVFPIIYFYL